jgi:hypothetical protein
MAGLIAMKQTATFLLAFLLLGSATARAQHPDLSGHWTLNQGQSDNPHDMMSRDSGGGRGGSGRGRGGRGGGGGGMGGGFGRGGFGGGGGGYRGGGVSEMSDEQRARMRQTMDLAFNAPGSLVLTSADSSLTLAADGETLVVPSNSHKVELRPKDDGEGTVDIKGRWLGNDFVVERSVSGGGKVIEDYLRSTEGKQLFVIVTFDGGRGRSITFRRIYDPVPSGN